MDIHDTLQEAITLVEAGKPRAFGTGVVVDKERLLQLLQHARTALPEEILAAASILAQRAQIITAAGQEAERVKAEADAEAEAIRAAALGDAEAVRDAALSEVQQLRQRAQTERETLVDEADVLLEAQRRADDLVRRAEHQAAAMRSEVDAYVDAKLAAISATLARTLDALESGRRKVRAQSETVVDESIALA